MKKLSYSLLALVMFLSLVSCATLQSTPTWSQLTPRGKAAFALSVYNTEYDNYLRMVKQPNLSEEAKQLLRTKKKILIQMKPVLDTYVAYVKTNQVPSAEVEVKLLNFINQLVVQKSQK